MFTLFLNPVAGLGVGRGKQGTSGAKFKEVSLSESSTLLASLQAQLCPVEWSEHMKGKET